MKERINRLAKGIIDSENPVITFLPEKFEERIRAGGVIKKEILITSETNLHIKGLVYSTNIRVKILNHAFGGIRNHIYYEINTQVLEDGDLIEGEFQFITTSGEKKIPYSFFIKSEIEEDTLPSLETKEDFCVFVKHDYQQALAFFRSPQFMKTPFMADEFFQMNYMGLRGRVDKSVWLEEFLVALGLKESVGIENVELAESFNGEILLRKTTWGYCHLQLCVNGDFVELSKSVIRDMDFENGEVLLSYHIRQERLVKGVNVATVVVSGSHINMEIPIQIFKSEEETLQDLDSCLSKKRLVKYLNLRVKKESEQYVLSELYKEMEDCLEEMDGVLAILFQAELQLWLKHPHKACLLLDECRDGILAKREEDIDTYCFFQYLSLQLRPDEKQKESLLRLLERQVELGDASFYIFLIKLKLDESLYEDPKQCFEKMKVWYYNRECCSPFLYLEAWKLLEWEADLRTRIDQFELQVLSFASKMKWVSRELALAIADLTLAFPYFHGLLYQALCTLYQQYPEKKLVSAICAVLMEQENYDSQAFFWYEKGVEAGVDLNHLYEAYLYALPRAYNKPLPQQIALYFSYKNDLDEGSCALLYENILTYSHPESSIYQTYIRDMERFAIKQMFQVKISPSLSVIYHHLIYRDIIDLTIGRVLPTILRTYEIQCHNSAMKYIVVCYRELSEETIIALEDGLAYVPLFLDSSMILFQDDFGNRYSQVSYEKMPVLYKPELEERCFEVYQQHPMLRLNLCSKILQDGIQTLEEALLLQQVQEEQNLHFTYRNVLLSALISYYKNQDLEEEVRDYNQRYFIRLEKKGLSKKELIGIYEVLVSFGAYKEVYEMIRESGCCKMDPSFLLKLCLALMEEKRYYQEELLLQLCHYMFTNKERHPLLLEYLCQHFNGDMLQMYEVLTQSVIYEVATYDLAERLIGQMLFSGDTTYIDQVFELYVKDNVPDEKILKAYFTIRSSEYFLENKHTDESVFAYLESAIKYSPDKQKISELYFLTLTKFYASLEALNHEQIELCNRMIEVLLEQGLIFPYFKELARFVPIPEEILDKGMIQYNGKRDSRIELRIRMLPLEESYHVEEMKRVYQGVFVKQKILFEGETMEYEIYELLDKEWVLEAKGQVACEHVDYGSPKSRFACLNHMGQYLNGKDEDRLRNEMKEYLRKNALVERLFPL